MRHQNKVRLERQIEFDNERTIARIIASKSGGPIRTIFTGREPHPTGHVVCVKAGHRAMPWESKKAELPAIILGEAASAVHELMTQPYRVEIFTDSGSRPLITFPDVSLTVNRNFAEVLESGVSFAEAIASWEPDPGQRADTCRLIIEVKDDDDPRKNDQAYREKLDLAAEIYRRRGWYFVEIIRSRDIDVGHVLAAAKEIVLDAYTKVDVVDAARAIDAIVATGGAETRAAVAEVLGGGSLGRAKLSALHVRRVVAIDLSRPLSPDSAVRIVDDGGSLL
jgi:hypothetical protein